MTLAVLEVVEAVGECWTPLRKGQMCPNESHGSLRARHLQSTEMKRVGLSYRARSRRADDESCGTNRHWPRE